MSDINKDEAERQKREAEQAAAAASARACQAESEVVRLRAIVEGIVDLPARANDIMAALQTARVRVETDACQASTVLADLKAIQDKAAAISNNCAEAASKAETEAGVAIRAAEAAKLAAHDVKMTYNAAQGDSEDVHDLRAKAQDAMSVIDGLRAKAERDAKQERTKSWLGLILAGLALVGVVVLFWFYAHQMPTVSTPRPQTPVPTAPVIPVPPTVTPAPLVPASTPVDKSKFMGYCTENGLTSDECETAWKRYTE